MILFSLLLAVMMTSCLNNYYNQFGGYPLSSETLVAEQDSMQIKLLVTYRYFYQAGQEDTTSLNISVKPMIDEQTKAGITIDRIALASIDNTYLMTFPKPAVYDKYGKYTLQAGTADKPCVFTVSRATPDYCLILTYSILSKDSVWIEKQQTFPINISYPTKKSQVYTN